MKIFLLLLLLFLVNCFVCDAGVIVPAGPLSYDDQKDIAFIQKHYERPKRSGSGDFLSHLKHTIGQGIKSKITHLAKSSAAGLGAFSHASSGHGHYYHDHYHPHHHVEHPHHVDYHPHDYGHKPFDFWSFKKSVLYTLLQAIKAIKGGVIAIKGQLIKGGGHLLTAKGKLIRGGGEALTSIGKNIATSAFMVIPHEEHQHHHHDDHHHHEAGLYEHGHYTHPAGHVSAASGPAVEYGPTGYYAGAAQLNTLYDGKHPAGLVVLKKIPTGSGHIENDVQETQAQPVEQPPDFRPLSDGLVPKMQNFMTSVFHASSSPDTETEDAQPASSNQNQNASSPFAQYLQQIRDYSSKQQKDPTMYVTPMPSVAKTTAQTPQQQPLLIHPEELASLFARYQQQISQHNNYYDYTHAAQSQQQQQQQKHQFKQPNNAFLINYPDYIDQQNMDKKMASKFDMDGSRNHKLQLKTVSAPKSKLVDSNNDLDIVRSLAFEVGPNGRVRIL